MKYYFALIADKKKRENINLSMWFERSRAEKANERRKPKATKSHKN